MIEPGYYKVIKAKTFRKHWDDDTEVENGEIAICSSNSDGEVDVLLRNHHWTFEENEFFETMATEPRGEELLKQSVLEAIDEINEAHNLFSEVTGQLAGFDPHIGESGKVESSSSLVPVGSGNIATQAKRRMAEARNTIAKTKKTIAERTKKLEALVAQQASALAAKAKVLEGMLQKAQEAIWSINLYLGKEEKIVRLTEGEPADRDSKIKFRQLVLFMDEECVAAIDDGGIDIKNVDEFDKWIIKKKKHIQQVVPEDKCIVALHIKRDRKNYGDPWLNMKLNESNLHWTYFLIRNGENLYRVYTDIVLGEHMFPKADEFDKIFRDKRNEDKVIKPGSKEYMKCMRKAEDVQKHYLRILLIIQGIIDRTEIFHPLPGGIDRINVCDRVGYDEHLSFIYDAENLLSSGMPSWKDWQKAVNNRLDIGCRVIGRFDGYGIGLRSDECSTSRIYPQTASRPDSMKLYTIEAKYDGAFAIRYARDGDTIYNNKWGEYDPHDPKVRARCILYTTDDFLLNFDAVTVKDCQFYIDCRTERRNYLSMIPLLRICIKLKKKEAKEEKPFRKLLIGEIMKKHNVSEAVVETDIDELISWWKFKNRTHRALVSDDAKALRMIVSEFKNKIKRELVRENTDDSTNAKIVKTIREQNPSTIYIAHKTGNKYAAYVPSNEFDVWVTEQVWTHNRTTGDMYLSSEKEWKIVDKRHKQWAPIYESDRWSKWVINPRRSVHLTDPEIDEIVKTGLRLLRAERKEGRFWHYKRNSRDVRLKIVAVTVSPESKINIFYSEFKPVLPDKLLYTSTIEPPTVNRRRIRWCRKVDRIDVFLGMADHDLTRHGSKRHWEIDFCFENAKTWSDYSCRVVFLDEKAAAQIDDEIRQHNELKCKEQEIRHRFAYVPHIVKEQVRERDRAILYRRFLEEHGDPELWDDFLEEEKKFNRDDGLHLDGVYSGDLSTAVTLCAERDIDIVGKTVGEVFGLMLQWKKFSEVGDHIADREAQPMDFIVPPPKPKDIENDDDLDDDDEEETENQKPTIKVEVLDASGEVIATTTSEEIPTDRPQLEHTGDNTD